MATGKQPPKFIVVSFYTIGTGYEEEVRYLKESLDKFSIFYDIQGIENLGTWQLNTHYKAKFLRQMIDKHVHVPIVWLDADAVLLRYPMQFDVQSTDIAVYYRYGEELLSGTIYLANNKKARKLLDMWIDANEENEERLEQYNLRHVIPAWQQECGGHVGMLPVTYCKIFDAEPDPIVIQHNQASRRLREAVRKK